MSQLNKVSLMSLSACIWASLHLLMRIQPVTNCAFHKRVRGSILAELLRRYEGMSALFLGVRAPKLLLLAGTDRLDRDLTIGQMQGRFQLALLPKARSRPPCC